MTKMRGFTLIEVIITVFIVTLLSMLVLKGYSSYIKLAIAGRVEKELLALTYRLENHKVDNFNYKGFSETGFNIPRTGGNSKINYRVDVVDVVAGHPKLDVSPRGAGWAIRAAPQASSNDNYTYLINSFGTKCKNLTSSRVTYLSCGPAASGSMGW